MNVIYNSDTVYDEEKDLQRERIGMEYRHENIRLRRQGRKLTYPNQQEAANRIIEHFSNGKLAVILVAQPGVGKTGVALETMYRLTTHADDAMCILTENCFSLSGMNDCAWNSQYKNSMLPSLRDHVSHRSKIASKTELLADLSNGFVCTDECHIASGKQMTQSKVMRGAGLLSIESLEQKNNKLLDISATPEGILVDLNRWGNKGGLVILQPGENYKGFQVMIDEQRIRDAPELDTERAVQRLLAIFDNRYVNSTTKKYFPFRINDEDIITTITDVCATIGWAAPLRHDSEVTIDNVDDMMKSPPAQHTIIFIKGFWRASKRLVRLHVGGSYEQPPKTRNTTATSQGLTARFCDTYTYEGDWLDPNLRPIHYCDLGAIEEYLEWFQNGCDYKSVVYSAARLKSQGPGGRLRVPKSKLHYTNVEGLVPTADSDEELDEPYVLTQTFADRDAARVWAVANIIWGGEWNQNARQAAVWNVNTCEPDGSPGITHIRYSGRSHPIPSEHAFRISRDLSKFGGGVRCVPVKNDNVISYIIVYKNSWAI
jgi:hypothetical protein